MSFKLFRSLAAYFELSKPKVSLLLTFGGMAGGFLAYNSFNLSRILIGTIAVFIASSGINAITNYIDRDIDKVMERTRNRPLPSGRINPPIKAIYFGIILVLISIIIIAPYSLYSVLWIMFGLFFDPIFYNYFTKRKTYWNIIIGSFAGGAPVLVVWSAVTNQIIALLPLLLFFLIVLWTPIHIWSLALRYFEDYKIARVPMLPIATSKKFSIQVMSLFAIALFIISLILYLQISLNVMVFAILVILNLIMVGFCFLLFFTTSDKYAYILFKITSPYLAVVFLIVVVHALL